jgi:hypothetical protein
VDEFLAAARDQLSETEAEVAARIVDWSSARGFRLTFERGGFVPVVPNVGWDATPIGVDLPDARVYLSGSNLRPHPPFRSPMKYRELIEQLHAIPAVVKTKEDVHPSITLVDLEDSENWARFFAVIDWAIAQIRAAAPKDLL